MSRPSQPSGISSARIVGSPPRANAAAARTSTGSSTGIEERVRLPHLLGHLAADDTGSARPPRLLEHAELVVDLGAAGDEHERALDLAQQPAQVLDSARAAAGIGRQEMSDASVEPCARCAEPKASLRRGRCLGELARELLVVLRLPRVEARVLEHAQPASGTARAGALQPARSSTSPVLVRLRPAEVRAHARPRPRRGRAATRASAATRGCACRRRPRRPRAARSGRRGRARACRRRRRHGRSAACRTLAATAASASGDLRDQIDQPARVAPLVVVPAEDLHQLPFTIVSSRRRSTSTTSATMSVETIGSSVYWRIPSRSPRVGLRRGIAR